MIPPDLPPELKAALDAKLEGLPRSDIAARAALISKTYRDGGSSAAIRFETDALAYALARMPATCRFRRGCTPISRKPSPSATRMQLGRRPTS